VQKQDERPALRFKAHLQHVHIKAIYAPNEAGADAGGEDGSIQWHHIGHACPPRGEPVLRGEAAGKDGCDFCHEPRHLVLDLRMRLQADIKVEDHLVKAGGPDLLQSLGDLR
jgi:hypothetical protein